MQLRAPIGFFLLFGANSRPEKVQHFLVSPNSIKLVPNGMFFGAATGPGVLLCWGRCIKTSTFWRDPPHPSQNGFFHLIDKIADFLHNKPFFLIAPRILHYYWASAQPCAVNNTFFSLWKGPKICFFHFIDKIADFLHNKRFFLIARSDLHYYWASAKPCAALRS